MATEGTGEFMQNVLKALAQGFSMSAGPQPMMFAQMDMQDQYGRHPIDRRESSAVPAVIKRASECEKVALTLISSEERLKLQMYFTEVHPSVVDVIVMARSPKSPLNFSREVELIKFIQSNIPTVLKFTTEMLEDLRKGVQTTMETGGHLVHLPWFHGADQHIVVQELITVCLSGQCQVGFSKSGFFLNICQSYMAQALASRRRFILCQIFGENFVRDIRDRVRTAAKEGRDSLEIQVSGEDRWFVPNIENWLLTEVFEIKPKKHGSRVSVTVKFLKREGATAFMTLLVNF